MIWLFGSDLCRRAGSDCRGGGGDEREKEEVKSGSVGEKLFGGVGGVKEGV